MTAIPTGDTINFDHTFKVAANIGFHREDSTWVFIVMNSIGQVLIWQLTEGTAFAQVGTLLEILKERSPALQTVYIDDCCKLRGQTISFFGSGISVKLDLFHAVQRITHTLRKRLPLTKQCMQDLNLVFWTDGDSGEKRKSVTASPEIMLSKLNTFVGKWKDIQDCNRRYVFTSDTLIAN